MLRTSRLATLATPLSALSIVVLLCSSCSGDPQGPSCSDPVDCPCYQCTCDGAPSSYAQGCKSNGTCSQGEDACSSSCEISGGSLASFDEADATQCEE